MLTIVDAITFSERHRRKFIRSARLAPFFSKTRKMHRTLKIPEVVQLICFHIYPDRRWKPSKDASRDLARLARTCSIVSEHALDALWAFQDTVMHVLECMPAGIWKKDGVSTPCNTYPVRKTELLDRSTRDLVAQLFKPTGNGHAFT
jgi:hypothetical protein